MYENPTEEIYKKAADALWSWTFRQEDIDDLWEKTDESSKVVVDAIWPLINSRKN